jgi:uncharacterized protein
MERRVLFIQGGSKGAHEADAKLAASLERELGRGYRVRFPKLPNEAKPEYAAWKDAIVRDLGKMGNEAILVGHSIGASVVIKLLCEGEANAGLAGVFLVSTPFWHDHLTWQWEEAQLPKNAGARIPKGVPLYFYHGRDDETVPFSHVEKYAGTFPKAVVRRLGGRDHQLNDDLSEVARDIRALD